MKLVLLLSWNKNYLRQKNNIVFYKIIRSVYITENSSYRSLKNRSCVTVFGPCSATLTVGEPLGDVFGSANLDFRISVTGIFNETNASKIIMSFNRPCYAITKNA